METPIIFSGNILRELDELVVNGKPVLSSEKGNLFLLENLHFGAIKLGVSVPEYFEFIKSLAEEVRPRPIWLVAVKNRKFEIVVNAQVEVTGNSTFINGKKIALL